MQIRRITLILFFIINFGFSQNNKEHVTEISENACDCISNINSDDEQKNKAIKNCIANAIVTVLKTDVSSTANGISEIQIDKNDYSDIEKYLVENCKALKNISFSENKKFEHATSNNVLAQLAYDDGMEYLDQNDYENAILKFKKAIEIDPSFAFAWDNLGISYRKTNQYEKAIESYEKSLEINPRGRMPLMNIALTYNLNKEYKEAIKYYNKYISFYTDDPEGYYGLGLILYTNNENEKGLDNLVHAYTIYTAQQSPYRADAASKIGYMYNDLKKQGKEDIFNKVVTKYNLKIDIK
ncbi:MAG: tetratricopeptide repeat protein [Bacteroidota bacterium]